LLASCACAPRAEAEFAISFGADGGITIADPHVRFVDPNTRWPNPKPTVALGLDVAAYWEPSSATSLGFAISPTLFGAGPEPSPGLNFALGPRFVWRPGPLHLALDAELALSSFNDRCRVASPEDDRVHPQERPDCPPTTRDYEPAAVGFAFGVSPLVRVATLGGAFDVLVGPSFRYQSARYEYSDGGSFVLGIAQAVLGVRMYGDFGRLAVRGSATPPVP
jgi:hypothetical protein